MKRSGLVQGSGCEKENLNVEQKKLIEGGDGQLVRNAVQEDQVGSQSIIYFCLSSKS